MDAAFNALQRIEAAADRLCGSGPAPRAAPTAGGSEAAVKSSAAQSTAVSAPAPVILSADGEADEVPESITAYDKIINTKLQEVCSLAAAMGEVVAGQAELVKSVFDVQRQVINIARQSRKPGPKVLVRLFGPMSSGIDANLSFKDNHKDAAAGEQEALAMLTEGVTALGWLDWSGSPISYIGDVIAETLTPADKLKARRGMHEPLALKFLELLHALKSYVEQYHKDGLTWGTKVRSMTFWDNALTTAGNDPVEKTEPKKEWKPIRKVKMPVGGGLDSTPVFERQGKRWVIEFQEGRSDLVVEDTNQKQSVRIYKCKECVVTIKGKVSNIGIEHCSRVGVVFDDVIAMCEFTNSQRCQVQVMGMAPTIAADKCDGLQIYLNENSLGTEVVTAKCAEVNVSVPSRDQDGEMVEMPVPEQFKTTIDANGNLVTLPSESV